MVNKDTLINFNGLVLEQSEITKYEKETLNYESKKRIQDNVKRLIVQQNMQEINGKINDQLEKDEKIIGKFKGKNVNIIRTQAISNAFSYVGGYGTDWAVNILVFVTNKKVFLVAANTMWGFLKLKYYLLDELEYIKTMRCDVYLKFKAENEIDMTLDNEKYLKIIEGLSQNENMKNITISIDEKRLLMQRNIYNYISVGTVIALLIYIIQLMIK